MRVHAWAVGVEYADYSPVEAEFANIYGGQHFGEALAFVVASAQADGVHVAPVFLFLRVNQWVAVGLGGGGHQVPGVVVAGQVKHILRAPRVDEGDLQRHPGEICGRSRAGEVEYRVNLGGQINSLEGLHDVVLDQPEVRVFVQVLDVLRVPGQKVVNGCNFVPFAQ